VRVDEVVEREVGIGDVFEVGDGVVEVRQARERCVKVCVKDGKMKVVKEVEERGYRGFYLGVVKEGMVCPDEGVVLVEKGADRIRVHE
uniref:MOSC domain-containing protein n=1 Tax=Bacillus altitudinis TaxID=293387 RepID=UPI001C92D9FA